MTELRARVSALLEALVAAFRTPTEHFVHQKALSCTKCSKNTYSYTSGPPGVQNSFHHRSINKLHTYIMIKKQPYTAPEAETLELRFEGVICGSLQPNGTESGNVIDSSGYGFTSWD